MALKSEDNELKKDLPVQEAPYADLYKMGFWDYRVAKLTIIWCEEISKKKQMIILKKLFPKLNELSISNINEIFRKNEYQWQFAEMGWGDAIDLAEKAKKLGVNILVEEILPHR